MTRGKDAVKKRKATRKGRKKKPDKWTEGEEQQHETDVFFRLDTLDLVYILEIKKRVKEESPRLRL